VRLTVLGSAASYPDAGRACAGHLVQHGGTSVLFDCGNGVLSNLGTLIDPTTLAAVFVTHQHIDHFADVYALQAALRYAPTGPMPPLPLHLPRGLFPRMQSVLGEHGGAELASAFEVRELVAGETVHIGELSITPRRVEHVGEAFGLVAEAGGKRLCYTSDTKAGAAVRAAAEGADVILAEATMPPEFAGRAPHLTAAEAATLAAEVGASALVLTHLWPTVDRAEAHATCERIFSGRVLVADELDAIDLD
jgi:ribonuclease BN (tRNA processing enzyme)